MSILLYELYGNDRRYHLELTYSVLSAMRYLRDDPAGIRIVLFAEAHNQRPDLPIENVLISAETFRKWQFDGTYNHAAQPHSLRHALDTYGESTVLMDGDTIFKAHPKHLFERVSPGHTLLNAKEVPLSHATYEWPGYRDILEKSGGVIAGVPFGPDTVMYNSGIMGVHPEDAALVDLQRDITREIRGMSDVFTAVQLAASMAYPHNSEVSVCDDILEHYWHGPRAYYHYQIDKLFPDIMRGGGIEDADVLLPPLEHFPSSNAFFRLIGRAKRLTRGAPDPYEQAYVAYLNALRLKTRDPNMANVWALRAADVLAWSMTERLKVTERDFRRFSPAALDGHPWLRPEVRRRWLQYWAAEVGPGSA